MTRRSSPSVTTMMQARIALTLVLVLGCAAHAFAQTTYHLHSEASSTAGHAQLKTADPHAPTVAIQSIELKNLSPTAVVIKQFDTQAGVPGTAGSLASGSIVTFTIWMKKTANPGAMYPQARLRLNNDSGPLICTATGTSPLTTTLTKFIFSCEASAVQLTATDRFWVSAGIDMTGGPGNKSVKAEVHLEGTLNGNYDSYVAIPAITPPQPVLTDLSPVVGVAATSVTLTGEFFGATGTVTFNGVPGTPSNWNATSITVPVPSTATTGLVRVATTGGTSNGLTFTVVTSGALSGTVTRATTGVPIAGATVDVLQSGVVVASRTTAANGTYSVAALSSGSYDVRVAAAGLLTQVYTNVAVGAGATVRNAALDAAGTVTGRITEPDGLTGIAGASVTATGSGGAAMSTTADGTGAYTIGGLAPGTYSVEASAPAFASQAQSGVAVADAGNATVNLSLPTAAPPTVRYVYDEVGRLVAVVDTTGETARYAYDAVGNVTSISRHASSTLAVLEISPNRGPVSTVVTITGSGFSPTLSQNAVTFAGTPATVTSATATSIVTTVPSGAVTGPIAVTVGSGSDTSATNFEVTASSGAPTITSFTPAIGTTSTLVTVNGTNFAASTASNLVDFNIRRGGLNSATPAQVIASVPQLGTSGRIRVTTAFGAAISAADFYVAPPAHSPANVDLTARVSFGQPTVVTNTNTTKLQLLIYDAQAGQPVSLQFTNITDGTRSFAWRRADGTYFINGQSGGTFVDATIMPAAGTYTVELLPGTTGNRTVIVHDATEFTGTIAPGGDAVLVPIGAPGQNARLTFTGVAERQVSATLSSVTIPQSDVSVLNPDGTTLGPALVLSPSEDFMDARTLPVNGSYTVLLNPRQTHIGNASVTLHDATDTTGPIAPDGNAVVVATSIPGQNGRRTFTAAAGERVILKISGSTYATGFTCGVGVSIRDPQDVVLAADNCVAQGEQWIDAVLAPVAGTYSVYVNPMSTNIGQLTVTLFAVAADLTGTILDETAIADSLSKGQNARYTYSGTAGTRISLNVPATSISSCSTLAILNPDSSVLSSGLICPTGFREPVTLPTTGTYTVVLDPSGPAEGTFTLVLYVVSADLSGTITPGTPLPLTIEDPGQNARYTFSGTTGQRVALEIANSALGCSAVAIRNPDETVVWNTTVCPTGFSDVKILGVNGTFSVTLNPNGAAEGSATLKLTNVPADDVQSTTIGAPGGATVNTTGPGQNAAVTFSATAGQVVDIIGSNSNLGCTTFKLLRPDGSQQASTFSCGGFTFNDQTLATAGTYRVSIDPSGTTVGHVTIVVQF
ncbi:MAG TPA: carboxypeptidase regulatory-like domain-containing protein [Vicinamibacterales bacterium]|nr:carboxypeptidase regulatory-like domain-containing protein [Vicinamibacterales bacterium]